MFNIDALTRHLTEHVTTQVRDQTAPFMEKLDDIAALLREQNKLLAGITNKLKVL